PQAPADLLSGATDGYGNLDDLAIPKQNYLDDAAGYYPPHPREQFVAGSNRNLIEISYDVAFPDSKKIGWPVRFDIVHAHAVGSCLWNPDSLRSKTFKSQKPFALRPVAERISQLIESRIRNCSELGVIKIAVAGVDQFDCSTDRCLAPTVRHLALIGDRATI